MVPLKKVKSFTVGFVPGVVLSVAYSSHLLLGPMALVLLPAALLLNLVVFFVMRAMFHDHGLKIRRNVGGLLIFIFGYSLLLQPARVAGHLGALLRPRKAKIHHGVDGASARSKARIKAS